MAVILIAELQCWGYEHIEVNAALVLTTCAAYPEHKVLFMAEKVHLCGVKERIGMSKVRVTFEEIAIAPRSCSQYRRFTKDLILVSIIMKRAESARKGSKIIFCSVTSSILYALKGVRLFYRSTPVLAVLHSNVASINIVESYRPWHYLFRLKFALYLLPSREITYLVYGEFIKKQIQYSFPRLLPHCIAIDHPYIFSHSVPAKCSEQVTFSALGNGRLEKGTDIFFQLAHDIAAANHNGTARFMLIGHIYDATLRTMAGDAVTLTSADNQPLLRSEYEQKLQVSDYTVFCCRAESYKFFASGALFDAFSFAKPIIALRTPQIEYCFERMGDIGYLCDDYDDMKKTMLSLIERDNSARYAEQCTNIINGRALFSPSVVAVTMQQVWHF